MYPNITLTTPSTSLSATLFTPDAARGYYRSTRFDHGSMLGELLYDGHTLFPSTYWRRPHDPLWPESGVGLAAEWGCGEDGARCGAGWGAYPAGASNGVLGYESAKAGEPFLKIGVGALVKGSCAGCDAQNNSDLYRFNSPYRFHGAPPEWRMVRAGGDVVLTHEAALPLGNYAYRLTRTYRAAGSSVVIETVLENLGVHRITTPYYSHNFLSLDATPLGERSVALGLDVAVANFSDAPWAAPIGDYFRRAAAHTLRTYREVPAGAKLKAVFRQPEHGSRGGWTASYDGGPAIAATLDGPRPLWAYNLYCERETLSAEPIQLVDIGPGERATLKLVLRLGPARSHVSGWSWRRFAFVPGRRL